MKSVAIAAAALLTGGLWSSAPSAAQPSWQHWNSDHGHLALRIEGDQMIGLFEGYDRFELQRAADGTWKGIVTFPFVGELCPGDAKLDEVVWGNLTLKFDDKLENFVGTSDFCGTGVPYAGAWNGGLRAVDKR